MRTNELINTLVGDHASQPRPKPVAHGLVMAIIGGLAISAVLFSITLGPRPDCGDLVRASNRSHVDVRVY